MHEEYPNGDYLISAKPLLAKIQGASINLMMQFKDLKKINKKKNNE